MQPGRKALGLFPEVQSRSQIATITHYPSRASQIFWQQTKSIQIQRAPLRAQFGLRSKLSKLPRFPTTDATRHEAFPEIELCASFDIQSSRLSETGIREWND